MGEGDGARSRFQADRSYPLERVSLKTNKDRRNFRPWLLHYSAFFVQAFFAYYTRSTLPERKQREHTERVLCVPFTLALTFLMLGFHCLFVLRFECDTASPKTTLFPQSSHFAILYTSICLSIILLIYKISKAYYITTRLKLQ